MHSILLKSIYKKALIILVVIIWSPKISAQEIDENYIFYSPSDEQMGTLSLVSKELHIFTNNERILLMRTDNKHLDTLELSSMDFSGMLQYVIVINDSTLAVGSYDNYGLINIVKNQMVIERYTSRSLLRKSGVKKSMYVLLPQGMFTYEIKKKRKEFTYQLSFYNQKDELIHEKEIKFSDLESNEMTRWALDYPHQISFDNSIVNLNLKGARRFLRFNTINGKTTEIKTDQFVGEEEAADIFFDPIKKNYYLIKYVADEKAKARVYVHQIDINDLSNYRLNDTVLELKKIRGGINNGQMMLMDDFKGSLGFYLVPINELH